jgi:hypothetical protein
VIELTYTELFIAWLFMVSGFLGAYWLGIKSLLDDYDHVLDLWSETIQDYKELFSEYCELLQDYKDQSKINMN